MLKQLQRDFREQACVRHGLRCHTETARDGAKFRAVASVLAALEGRAEPVLKSAIWFAVRDAIEPDPMPFVAALGLTVPRAPFEAQLRADHDQYRPRTDGRKTLYGFERIAKRWRGTNPMLC